MSDTDTSEAPAASVEQAADLAALTAQAKSAPATAAAPAEQAAKEPPPPSAQGLAYGAMIVQMLRPLAEYAVPALKKAPEALWEPVPVGFAVLLDHYKISESDAFNSPWARAAIAVAPLAAFALVNTEPEKPAAEPAQLPAPVGQAQAPGAQTVTFGAVTA